MIEICVSYYAIELEFEPLSQAFPYKFCESFHNDGFWDFSQIILQIFGRLLLDFLLSNRSFCERDKNHKFGDFKSHKSLFFNEVTFYFIWSLHCIKSVRISLYSVWMWENADQNNSKYEHFLRSVVL